MKTFQIALAALLMAAVPALSNAQSPKRADFLLPMFGGAEVVKTPSELEADAAFIRSATQMAGSREEASRRMIQVARGYYDKGDFDTAMKRLNEAWILDPNNPDVYRGFSDVLRKQGKSAEADEMLRRVPTPTSTPTVSSAAPAQHDAEAAQVVDGMKGFFLTYFCSDGSPYRLCSALSAAECQREAAKAIDECLNPMKVEIAQELKANAPAQKGSEKARKARDCLILKLKNKFQARWVNSEKCNKPDLWQTGL